MHHEDANRRLALLATLGVFSQPPAAGAPRDAHDADARITDGDSAHEPRDGSD